jgi:Spy/CpxP family protein refolding chaperone
MDFFAKEKMTFWAVILLIILNVATLSVLWIRSGRDRSHRHDGKEHPFAPAPMMQGPQQAPPMPPPPPGMIEQELGLSAQQADALKKLREGHFEKVDALMKEIEKTKKELFDMLFAENVDQAKVAEKINFITGKRSEVERLTFNHFKDVIALCDGKQKEKFRGILEGALKMPPPQQQGGMAPPSAPPREMMPPPPPAPGPHGHHAEPGPADLPPHM